MTAKRFKYAFLFLFVSLLSFSQDLIIKKDSTRILCNITGEDSLTLYYSQRKNNTLFNSKISKELVLKYYSSSSKLIIKKRVSKKDSVLYEITSRLHINFIVGSAIPFGIFAKKNLNDTNSGFAKKGITFNLSATLRFYRFFGISTMYMYQKNNLDADVIAQGWQAKYGGGFESSSTPWLIKGFMGGVFFTYPIKPIKNLYLEMNELVGKPNFTSAGSSITQSTSSFSFIEGTASVHSFAFITSAGLRYKLTDYLCATLAVDFLFAKPNFTNVQIEETLAYGYGFYSASTLINFPQKIETCNVKAGLTLIFGRIK
jgi:hypothetical protein